MTFDFTLNFDMLDNLTSLTLRVTGQTDTTIPKAINSPADWSEAEKAAGNVLAGDRTWTWPIVATPTQPALGSILVDVDGNLWTILSLTKQPIVNTWSARCRNLLVVYGLNNLATVLKATYRTSASGEAVATWATLIAGVAAHFQPESTDTQLLADAEWSKATYNVYLGSDIFSTSTPEASLASADYRLVDSTGRHYRITQYQRADRIDALPIAVCVLITEGSEGGAIDRISSSSGS